MCWTIASHDGGDKAIKRALEKLFEQATQLKRRPFAAVR
jgi:hypothetical protein